MERVVGTGTATLEAPTRDTCVDSNDAGHLSLCRTGLLLYYHYYYYYEKTSNRQEMNLQFV